MKYTLLHCYSLFFLFFIGCFNENIEKTPFVLPEGKVELSFSATADMRYFTGDNIQYYRGACERIASGGAGQFMISPGDIDPPNKVYNTIQKYIGEDYLWYPVTGNHETETTLSMDWLREFNPNGDSLPGVVRAGPSNCIETTYSFNYANTHFVVINEYFEGTSDIQTDGDISAELYSWLETDLSLNDKQITFVIGHEPAYPQPDEENGRQRHMYDSLNKYPENRDSFWQLLKQYNVMAYICGHTHNFSAVIIDGIWQVDIGHARGYADVGAKSTFVMFYIMVNGEVWIYVYRLSLPTGNYKLERKQNLSLHYQYNFQH